jgi:polyhydroxybutyrate depolymerase
MRALSSFVFVAGALLTVLACSSSDPAPAAGAPDSGTSSGPDPNDVDANASSSTSGGTSGDDAAPDAAIVWTKQTTETLQHAGSARTYILSVPLAYDANKSYPLYMWLHGNPSSAAAAAQYTPVEPVTKDEAIVVYPEAKFDGNWDHAIAETDNVDGSFLLALIDVLATKYNIDKGRVLLSGYSGGAFMSSAMACRFYASFKAIGIHAGGAPYNDTGNPTCDGASIATLVTHGGMDTATGGDSGFYAAEYWRKHNGCASTRTATAPVPCETYDECDAGKPVEYCFDPNWGHGFFPNAIAIEWPWFKALP